MGKRVYIEVYDLLKFQTFREELVGYGILFFSKVNSKGGVASNLMLGQTILFFVWWYSPPG